MGISWKFPPFLLDGKIYYVHTIWTVVNILTRKLIQIFLQDNIIFVYKLSLHIIKKMFVFQSTIKKQFFLKLGNTLIQSTKIHLVRALISITIDFSSQNHSKKFKNQKQ